jgi:hypothetical protein
MKLIIWPVFIISLSIGLFMTYITNPNPTIIFIYPNPDNLNDFQYKDAGDTCYSFESQKVDCPQNKDDISEYPVQKSKMTYE